MYNKTIIRFGFCDIQISDLADNPNLDLHYSGYLYVYSSHCFPYIFYGNDEENLLNNQNLCNVLNTSFFQFSQRFCLIEQCCYKEKLDIGHS